MKDRLYWERQDKEELERISRVLIAVKKYLLYMVLAGVVSFIVAYLVTDNFIPKVYTAEASFFIKKYPTNVVYKDSEYVDALNRRYKKYVLALCGAFLQEDVFYNAIGDRLTECITKEELGKYFELDSVDEHTVILPESLKKSISYEVDSDASLIKCTVKADSQELANEIFTAVEDVVSQKYFEIYGSGMLTRIGDVISTGKPVYPNPVMNGVKCGLVALSIVLLIVVVKYAYDDRIYNGIEFENKLTMPLLGVVDDKDKLVFENIKCKLDFILADKKNNMVVFTSPNYSVNMNKVVSGLAAYIANDNKKVVIVDLDLHCPMQHKFFDLENSTGFVDLCNGKCSLEKAVQSVDKFDVLTVGSECDNPTAVFMSEKKDTVLNELKTMYDYVFIVASPINLYSDVKMLDKLSTEFILVLEEKSTKYKELSQAVLRLNNWLCDIGGTVLLK